MFVTDHCRRVENKCKFMFIRRKGFFFFFFGGGGVAQFGKTNGSMTTNLSEEECADVTSLLLVALVSGLFHFTCGHSGGRGWMSY